MYLFELMSYLFSVTAIFHLITTVTFSELTQGVRSRKDKFLSDARVATASTTSANIFKNKPSSSVAADWTRVVGRWAERSDVTDMPLLEAGLLSALR